MNWRRLMVKALIGAAACMVLLGLTVGACAAKDYSAIIRSVYSQLLASRGNSYNGWCGQYVLDQLSANGIGYVTNGGSCNGNQIYYSIVDGAKTSGGYTQVKFGGNNALYDIVNRYGSTVENIVVSFTHQSGHSDSNPGAGHTNFLYAIVDGNIYFSESYGGYGYKEGDPQVLSIGQYMSRYNNSYGNIIGAVVYEPAACIQLWGIEENSEWSGNAKLRAKRTDNDSNHYAIFYIDDVPITGHINSDDNGFFNVTIDTTNYNDGTHQLSIYYANTQSGSWDVRNIVFKNIIKLQNVEEGSVWGGDATFIAKRFDNDDNHYAIFYLDDVPITGHISADANGYFRRTLNTTEYPNGHHQLSIYYACTSHGGWDVRQIEFYNEDEKTMSTPDFILPASLTVIEEGAFEGLSMTVVQCPEGLKEIGADAFRNCARLKEIYIPASVTFIDGGALEGCAEDLTIFGHAGSVAEAYANLNGIEFVETED